MLTRTPGFASIFPRAIFITVLIAAIAVVASQASIPRAPGPVIRTRQTHRPERPKRRSRFRHPFLGRSWRCHHHRVPDTAPRHREAGPRRLHDRGDPAAPATGYTDPTVEEGTWYAYRVKARNAHGYSAWSNFVNVETPAEPQQTSTSDQSNDPDDDYPATTATAAVIGRSQSTYTVNASLKPTATATGSSSPATATSSTASSSKATPTTATPPPPAPYSPRSTLPMAQPSSVPPHEASRERRLKGYPALLKGEIFFEVASNISTGGYRVTAQLIDEWEYWGDDVPDLPADSTTRGYLTQQVG